MPNSNLVCNISFFKYRLFAMLRLILACTFLFISGCSSPTYYRNVIKQPGWGAGNKLPATARPYVIKGRRYYPQRHYRYDRCGYASWYGYDCHGRLTATGDYFHMNGMTAAHRTLPLPCIVRVINLENGRSVILKVNDRGPFAHTHKRIIDVTQRAAKLLGFHKKGETRVRVICLQEASRKIAVQHASNRRSRSKPKQRRRLTSSLLNCENFGQLQNYKKRQRRRPLATSCIFRD